MRHRRTRLFIAASLAAATLAGCSSAPRDRQAEMIRSNPSPELYTLHDTPADVRNTLAIMENENNRMLRRDIGKVLLLDRPSRLTPEPVPW